MNHLTAPSRSDCAPKSIPPLPLADGTYSDAFAEVVIRNDVLHQDGQPMTPAQFEYWARRFFSQQFEGLGSEARCPMCDDQGCTFCVAMNAPAVEPEPEIDLTCPACGGAPEKCFVCYDCKGSGTSTPF